MKKYLLNFCWKKYTNYKEENEWVSVSEREKKGATSKTICPLISIEFSILFFWFWTIFTPVHVELCSVSHQLPKPSWSSSHLSNLILLHWYKSWMTLRLLPSQEGCAQSSFLCPLLYSFVHPSKPSVSPLKTSWQYSFWRAHLCENIEEKCQVYWDSSNHIYHSPLRDNTCSMYPWLNPNSTFSYPLLLHASTLSVVSSHWKPFFQNIYFPPLCFDLCYFPQSMRVLSWCFLRLYCVPGTTLEILLKFVI